MKIKNSVSSISPDAAVFLLCFGILIACPIRIFQMIKNMDPITGFYNDYGHITVILLYAVLAVFSVLILLLTFLSARVPAAIAPHGRRIPLGIASLLFAATLFYDSLSNYFSTGSESTATIIQNAKSVSNLQHIHAIFAFLSCCYFLIVAISYFSGNTFSKKLKLLSLAPLVWAIARVMQRITIIISILRVSELLFELFASVFLMIFFLSFARVMSEVNSGGSMWSVIGCGCTATLFLLTYSIPRVMLFFTGNADKLVSGYPIGFSDLGCALFILLFIVTTLRSGYSLEDAKGMMAEIEAASQENKQEEQPQTPAPEVQSLRDDNGNIVISRTQADSEEKTAEDRTEDAQ